MIPTSTRAGIQLKSRVPASTDVVAILIHKGARPDAPQPLLNDGERAAVQTLIASGIARGKSNEVSTQLIGRGGKRRVMIVGLGDPSKFSAECLREAAATLVKAVSKQPPRSLAILVPHIPQSLPGIPGGPSAGSGMESAIAALTEGILLGGFKYEEFKGTISKRKDADGNPSRSAHLDISLVTPAAANRSLHAALNQARIVADAQNFARTIASRPGNSINPPALADVARKLARETGLACRILDEKQLARLGMGGILAVGAGSSATPPRLIVLQYKPAARSASRKPPLLVVGKAITFDTGGISIKPAERMGRMIFDKSGGIAVLGLMYAAAKLKLPIPLVGILSSAENHISETAYRPGDILHMYNGITVEVTNTDAEGRLVLADALAWGIQTFKPAAVVDLATLTGGVIVALGRSIAGILSNSDPLVNELQRASNLAGEKIWRLPLGQEHRDLLKSDPADIVNSAGRDAHPLQGGAFLSYFVPETTPWAHLDIAGVADTEKDQIIYSRGATGWGVRTLVRWIMDRPGSARHK